MSPSGARADQDFPLPLSKESFLEKKDRDVLDFTDQPFRVLLTGFSGFLGIQDNPTQAIATSLGKSGCEDVEILPEPIEKVKAFRKGAEEPAVRVRVCWEAHVLPVNRTGAMWTTEHLSSMASVPYAATVHMGLEDFAKGLKLETMAANIRADDSGADGTEEAVEGAPHLLPTTVNLGWLSLKNIVIGGGSDDTPLRKPHEMWSRDPGSYYCNEVYFRSLQYVRSRPIVTSMGALLPVLFLHVQSQNSSSIDQDVSSVKQIVAHAMWATYLAPNTPQFPELVSLASSITWANNFAGIGVTSSSFTLFASTLLSFICGVLLALAFLQRRLPSLDLSTPLFQPLLGESGTTADASARVCILSP